VYIFLPSIILLEYVGTTAKILGVCNGSLSWLSGAIVDGRMKLWNRHTNKTIHANNPPSIVEDLPTVKLKLYKFLLSVVMLSFLEFKRVLNCSSSLSFFFRVHLEDNRFRSTAHLFRF